MVTLDSIARSYLLNREKSTLHGYLRIIKFLLDFLRQFSLKNAFYDKTVVLRLDQKKAIPFPEDFVMWSKVGWQAGDRIVAFQRDGSINLHHSTSDDGEESPTVNLAFNNTQWPYNTTLSLVNYTNDNGDCISLPCYGIGYNGLGYFRVSWRDREIQFSTDTPANFEIYLEYKTNGFNPKSMSVIPEVAAKLGEDYIHWQVARYDKRLGDSSSETEARRINYLREYDEMISITEPIPMAALAGIRARGFDVNKLVY